MLDFVVGCASDRVSCHAVHSREHLLPGHFRTPRSGADRKRRLRGTSDPPQHFRVQDDVRGQALAKARGLMPSTPPGSSAVDVAKRTTSMVVGEECQLFSTILMETPLGSAENSREATEASRRHANRGSACGWLRMPAPDPTPQRCTGVFSPAHTLSSPP